MSNRRIKILRSWIKSFYNGYISNFNHEGNSSLKILINTIPKSGTNLIGSTLLQFPLIHHRFGKTIYPLNYSIEKAYYKVSSIRNGQYRFSHLKYCDDLKSLIAESNIKMIFMIRDPRDIVVSYFNYVTKIDKKHKSHEFYRDLPDDETRLMTTITGKIDIVEPISKILEDYYPWLLTRNCHTIRFEDLVGPHGGGEKYRQLESVKELADFLNISLNSNQINNIIDNLYSTNSPTFSTGQVGTWRKYFSNNHIDEFKRTTLDMLINYGYENDGNW